jgi:hypothetical protein
MGWFLRWIFVAGPEAKKHRIGGLAAYEARIAMDSIPKPKLGS